MALSDKEIGMRVRNVRRENELTQDKFARKFHMTQQTLSRYENGKISIPNGTLENIAKGMDVPIGFFLGIDSMTFTDDELRLLELYRRADDRVKEYIFEMVRMSATKLKGKDS